VSHGIRAETFCVGVVIGVVECLRKTVDLHCLAICGIFGSAPGRIRTSDSRFRKPLLYPLSYRRKVNEHLFYWIFSPLQTFLAHEIHPAVLADKLYFNCTNWRPRWASTKPFALAHHPFQLTWTGTNYRGEWSKDKAENRLLSLSIFLSDSLSRA
jgi:hypothetical protein